MLCRIHVFFYKQEVNVSFFSPGSTRVFNIVYLAFCVCLTPTKPPPPTPPKRGKNKQTKASVIGIKGSVFRAEVLLAHELAQCNLSLRFMY